jgi:hypothetical protein
MDVVDNFANSSIGGTLLYLTRICMKGFGVILSLVAIALFTLTGIFHFTVIIPLLGAFPSISFFINLPLGLYVTFSLYFNYLMCMFTSPGKKIFFLI